MLAQKNRLSVVQFNQNPQPIVKKYGRLLNCFFKKNDRFLRIGILVPKKLDKRSSFRHKTKRLISEMVQKNFLPKLQSGDFLIVARLILSDKKREELILDLLDFAGQRPLK